MSESDFTLFQNELDIGEMSITELGLLVQKLQKRVTDLEIGGQSQKLPNAGEMAGEIAHELNQPLMSIASFGDTCLRLLQSGDYDRQEVIAAMEEIVRQVGRASNIVRTMSNFASRNECQRAFLSLNALLRAVRPLVEREARHHNIDLSFKTSESDAWIYVDDVLIELVVLNVVRNAIEAMVNATDSGRGKEVTLEARCRSGAEIVIRDSGPGISSDAVSKMFEPFFTTKSQGTGLGLSLSRSIVLAHGGELYANNNEDGGAVFRIVLPMVEKGAMCNVD